MNNIFLLLLLAITIVNISATKTDISIQKEDRLMIPPYLLKIVSYEDWQTSKQQETLLLSPDDKDFIHFSTDDQLNRIIEKYWTGKKAVVLKVATAKLSGNLIFEANRPGGDKYYHLYNGSIPVAAIIAEVK